MEQCFYDLYNVKPTTPTSSIDTTQHINDEYVDDFNNNISISEIHAAVFKANRNRASGIDEIPVEVFRNDTAYLYCIFCLMCVSVLELFQ